MASAATTALQLLLSQAVVTTLISLSFLVSTTTQAALAALVGGCIALLVSALTAWQIFAGPIEWSPQRFLRRMLGAQWRKIIFAATLLVLALKGFNLAPLPLLLAFALSLLMHGVLLLYNVRKT